MGKFLITLITCVILTGVAHTQTNSFPGGTLVRMSPFPHAMLSFNDSTVTITATQNTWHHITNAGKNLWTVYQDDFTVAGDSVTIIYPGDYYINLNVSMQGNNGEVYKLGVEKNGVAQPMTGRIFIANNSTATFATMIYLDNCVAGDDIKPVVMNITDNDDPVMKAGTMWIRWEFD